jgi:hypothetical protein
MDARYAVAGIPACGSDLRIAVKRLICALSAAASGRSRRIFPVPAGPSPSSSSLASTTVKRLRKLAIDTTALKQPV